MRRFSFPAILTFIGLCSVNAHAEPIRIVVSDSQSSQEQAYRTKAKGVLDDAKTRCVKTLDGARTLCVPYPKYGAQGVQSQGADKTIRPRHYAYTVDADSFRQVKETLEATGWYVTVEKDIIVHSNATWPDDPWFTNQGYLFNPATTARDAGGAHNFWSVLKVEQIEQQEAIGVAVLDSEFYDVGEEMIFHGGASFDDKGTVPRGNNFYSDISAYDTCRDHGLNVASIIGATPNNGIAIAGAGGNVKVYAANVLDCGTGGLYSAAEAIRWFAGESFIADGIADFQGDVRVLNLSLGAGSYEGEGLRCPSYMQQAIDFARSKGISIVISAGNDGNDANKHTPSNCDGVIAVGANNLQGYRSSFSNHGTGVDISAGGEMVSMLTVDVTREVGGDGSSYSAPFVSAALTHAYRLKPDLTPAQAELVLKLSARKFTDPACDVRGCGAGILDVKKMLAVTAALDSQDSNRISWALNDETECDQKWYVDNFGSKGKMCSMLKVSFLGDLALDNVKYRLFAQDLMNPDAPETQVLETSQSSVLLSKEEIDVGLFDYSVVLCTDEACSSDAIRFKLDTKQAFITEQPAVCEQ